MGFTDAPTHACAFLPSIAFSFDLQYRSSWLAQVLGAGRKKNSARAYNDHHKPVKIYG